MLKDYLFIKFFFKKRINERELLKRFRESLTSGTKVKFKLNKGTVHEREVEGIVSITRISHVEVLSREDGKVISRTLLRKELFPNRD